jgi:putative NADH-flavin reductase
VVRDPEAVQSPDKRVKLVKGDATNADSIAKIVRGADAVVSAISPRPNARGLPAPSLAANSRALIKGLRDAKVKRVLYVGGASSLEVAPGRALADTPDFPEMYREEAREGREALAIWRNNAKGLDWTYLSPAAEIAPGKRTGEYRTTDDKLLTDAAGRSFITFEDYAVAVLDELERPQHVASGSVSPTSMRLSRLIAGLLTMAAASACHDTSAPLGPLYVLVAVDGHSLPVV